MNLIAELKKEHAVITTTLERINRKNISLKECQKELFKVKSLLLDHLRKEDENLYPSLKLAARNNEYIRLTLKSFADDMDEISALAFAFFDKYKSGGKGMEFAKDYGQLYSKLSMRIRKEETVLYELFNSLDPTNRNKESG